MKALTLREPWASLVLEGVKTLETRSWATRYRGELFIHAGSGRVPRGDAHVNELMNLLEGPLHYGLVRARCELVDCVRIDAEYAREVERRAPLNYISGDYTPGRYVWVLEGVRAGAPGAGARHAGTVELGAKWGLTGQYVVQHAIKNSPKMRGNPKNSQKNSLTGVKMQFDSFLLLRFLLI